MSQPNNYPRQDTRKNCLLTAPVLMMRCENCKKRTTFRPWMSDKRKKYCAKCIIYF
jgi:hypothetical protein